VTKFMAEGMTQKWSRVRSRAGDVSGDAFGESELSEDSQCAREALLAVASLGVDRIEGRWHVEHNFD